MGCRTVFATASVLEEKADKTTVVIEKIIHKRKISISLVIFLVRHEVKLFIMRGN